MPLCSQYMMNSGKSVDFSQEWIKTNSPWFTYSNLFDGGFCLPCVIFPRAIRGSSDLGLLVIWRMKTFYKATEILRRHGTLQYYKNSMADTVYFLDVMEQSTPSVIAIAICAHEQQIQVNCF